MTIIVNSAPKKAYSILYAKDVKLHLRAIDLQHHSSIRDVILLRLQFEPTIEAQNRKPLKRPVVPESEWELRCGPKNQFRVFYRTNEKSREVHILAIGVKDGNRLVIGGEEVRP